MAKTKRVKCPECGDFFELDDYLEVGETTFCPMCDVALLVVDLDPPLLKIAESEGGTMYEGDDTEATHDDEEPERDEDAY